MGKHKIVKSAAAVALTASVVATAAAPQASAAAYKVNKKDQLVSSTTGKLVKGWKVFGGKLYKNGKLAPAKKYKIIGKGAAQRLYYGPTLKKGYKTANSKTLLFKDGKLADGWKQAGKNERLYKNGKLDKGYTVYTNVEGDKFLYLNGKLKKGDKTATRAGETLLFTDGLLSKGLKEFKGKTYYNGKVANGTIEGKEYDNGVLVTDIASVKAINSTTVEVTYKKDVTADVKAEDYTIEGLTVTNAAVKQTDKKVVVLTTSAQEGGKEYTLKSGDSSKTFTGVSEVVPTAVSANEIKPYQTSQQAVIGQQVTVKFAVSVAEGQSKAGIPVTFNIDNQGATDAAAGNFGEDKKAEVYTDENGVASYTYTQYGTKSSEDVVTAYTTGKPELRTSSVVYWETAEANILKVADVTTATTLANNGKKVYKVTGGAANGTVKVTFAENYEVTPDKINAKGFVVDATNGSKVNPYQTTQGSQSAAVIKLNAKGEAEFTVTGNDTAVTPVVFEDTVVGVDSKQLNRINKDERQATASTVTFQNIKTVTLTNEAQGVQNAAAAKQGDTVVADTLAASKNIGGRHFEAKLTANADGTTAPKGTKVYLTFADKDNAKQGALVVFDAAGKKVTPVGGVYTLETDKDGLVKYTVASTAADNYATPVVYLENGAKAGLDDADSQATAQTTYFGDAVVAKATLKFYNAAGKELALNQTKANEVVTVKYQTVDQNGIAYEPTTQDNSDTVTFDVNTTFGELKDFNITIGGQKVEIGNTQHSFSAGLGNGGLVEFTFTSDNESTVNFTATATKAALGVTEGTVKFVGASVAGAVTQAIVDAVNNATSKEKVAEALKDVAAYNTLSDTDKAAVVDSVFGNVQTINTLTKTINDVAKVTAINEANNAIAEAEKATTNGGTPVDLSVAANYKKAQEAIAKAEAAVKAAKDLGATVGAANTNEVDTTDLEAAKDAVKDADKEVAKTAAINEANSAVDAAKTAATKISDANTALTAANTVNPVVEEDVAAAEKDLKAAVEETRAAVKAADKAVKAAKDLGATVGAANTNEVDTTDLEAARTAVATEDLVVFQADEDVVAALAIDTAQLTPTSAKTAKELLDKAYAKYDALSAEAKTLAATEKENLDAILDDVNKF